MQAPDVETPPCLYCKGETEVRDIYAQGERLYWVACLYASCTASGPERDTPEGAIAAVAEPQRKAREVRDVLTEFVGLEDDIGDYLHDKVLAVIGIKKHVGQDWPAEIVKFVDGD